MSLQTTHIPLLVPIINKLLNKQTKKQFRAEKSLCWWSSTEKDRGLPLTSVPGSHRISSDAAVLSHSSIHSENQGPRSWTET